MTKLEKLKKLFPNAPIKDGSLGICPCEMEGEEYKLMSECLAISCERCRADYWNQECEG